MCGLGRRRGKVATRNFRALRLRVGSVSAGVKLRSRLSGSWRWSVLCGGSLGRRAKALLASGSLVCACDGERWGGVLVGHGCGGMQAFAACERSLALRVHITFGERHRGGER